MKFGNALGAIALFLCAVAAFGQSGSAGITNQTVSCSGTCALSTNAGGSHFDITLTGSVTSSTFTALGSSVTEGSFHICPVGGAFLWTWPAGAVGFGTITSVSGKCSRQAYKFDGSVLKAVGGMTTDGLTYPANGGTGVSNTATLALGTSNVNLGTLGTGIMKNTTTTGALSTATYADTVGQFGSGSCSGYLASSGGCSTFVRECPVTILGSGSAGALQTTDGITWSCYNDFGVTLTVTGVKCLADTGTTTTVTPIKHGGSSTSILSGALTCGNGLFAAGTLNGTPTLAAGDSIDANVTAAGTATGIRLIFTFSSPLP